MTLKRLDRIKGAMFEVDHLETLPDDDCNILFVSSRTLHILAGYAQYEVNFLGRYGKDFIQRKWVDTVDPGDLEEVFVKLLANNFRLEVVPMPCDFSALAEAINNVAAALGNQSAGCNCPQQGITCIDAADIQPDGTQNPPATEGEYGPIGESFPEGFDTLEDYLAYKCEAAHFIMDGLINVLRGVSPAFLGVATMAALSAYLAAASSAVGLAATLPPLAFVAILSILAGMLFLGAQFHLVLNSLADALDANRLEIICRLYQAQNTLNAINSVLDEIEDIIEIVVTASSIPGAVQGAARTALLNVISEMWNTATMNQLFQLTVDISYAGADCSSCGATAECEIDLQLGTGTILYSGVPFTLTAQDIGGGIYSLTGTVPEGGGCDFVNWCMEFVERSALDCTATNFTRELYWNSADTYNYGTRQYDFNHQPPGVSCFPPMGVRLPAMGFSFANNAPFTVTMRLWGTVPGTTEAPDESTACDV